MAGELELTGDRGRMRNRLLPWVFLLALLLPVGADLEAQAQGAATRTGRAAALNDLTGYWVSVVTEDWRLRMIVPDPHDYQTLPLTAAASKVADAWDPAADQAAGNQCRMGRRDCACRADYLWQDEDTRKSTLIRRRRLLHFGAAPQDHLVAGYSAVWLDRSQFRRPGPGAGFTVPASVDKSAVERREMAPVKVSKVITTRMRPGYLQNGVPKRQRTREEH